MNKPTKTEIELADRIMYATEYASQHRDTEDPILNLRNAIFERAIFDYIYSVQGGVMEANVIAFFKSDWAIDLLCMDNANESVDIKLMMERLKKRKAEKIAKQEHRQMANKW